MKKEYKENSSTKKQREPLRTNNSTRAIVQQPEDKLSRRSVVEVEISGLDEEGYGISCSETHALRIGGALPGDTVRAAIDHVALRMAFGHVIRILKPSPMRSKRPPCRVSSQCLGCPLIVMKYVDQAEFKRSFILKQLREYRELGEITVHQLLSPLRLIHYRTTARFIIRWLIG